MTFLEVSIATAIGAASMWAAASFFSFNVRQTRQMMVSKVSKRFEDQVRLAVAQRMQEYLDQVSVTPVVGPNCDNEIPNNDFVTFINTGATGTSPMTLDAGITLEVLDYLSTVNFLNSTGNQQALLDAMPGNAPYHAAFGRCTEGNDPYTAFSPGLPLYKLHGGLNAIGKAEFRRLDEFHFCLWMRPTSAQLAQETGMMAPAIFEGRYSVKNATTGEVIACENMETGTPTEIRDTPLLFDQVANTMGCTLNASGIPVCGDPTTQVTCDTWENCVNAYKANAVWRAELITKIKKARIGSLNYNLHWIASGMDTAAFGKAFGNYVYTAGN